MNLQNYNYRITESQNHRMNKVSTNHSVIQLFSDSVIRAPRRGFSLVELLVVIGIIAVLAGVLLATFGGSSESARAAQCLSNMKNLANACQTYGMKTGRYPNAGSVEILELDQSKGRGQVEKKYTERQAWISWDSEGRYPSKSHSANGVIGLYCDDEKKAAHALTNGCLWKYVSGSRSTYVCPLHANRSGISKTTEKGKTGGTRNHPHWSYLMNANFGWDTSGGSRSYSSGGGGHTDYGQLVNADKVLLFSEVPFMGFSAWQPEGTSGTTETDAILQFSSTGLKSGDKGANQAAAGNETIGANHLIGKNLFAHVAFADGHCEKLRIPYTGTAKNPQVNDGNLKELTSWLCAGKDVSLEGKSYEKLEN